MADYYLKRQDALEKLTTKINSALKDLKVPKGIYDAKDIETLVNCLHVNMSGGLEELKWHMSNNAHLQTDTGLMYSKFVNMRRQAERKYEIWRAENQRKARERAQDLTDVKKPNTVDVEAAFQELFGEEDRRYRKWIESIKYVRDMLERIEKAYSSRIGLLSTLAHDQLKEREHQYKIDELNLIAKKSP